MIHVPLFPLQTHKYLDNVYSRTWCTYYVIVSLIWYTIYNTQKAAIATLPLTMHPQWAEPHTLTSNTCTNHIIGMAQLTTPAIPTILQLTILTKIPPRGVRLGPGNAFSPYTHRLYKLLKCTKLRAEIILYLAHMKISLYR